MEINLKTNKIMKTAVEWLEFRYKNNINLMDYDFEQAKEMEKQQERSYSEEDLEIIEISSIEANYIPHYQTKEGQFLATKFNVKQFKNK